MIMGSHYPLIPNLPWRRVAKKACFYKPVL